MADIEKAFDGEIACLTETEAEQRELSTRKEQLKIPFEEKLVKVKKRLETLETNYGKMQKQQDYKYTL